MLSLLSGGYGVKKVRLGIPVLCGLWGYGLEEQCYISHAIILNSDLLNDIYVQYVGKSGMPSSGIPWGCTVLYWVIRFFHVSH